jgi:isoleucyl-tRNA synthetase
MYLIVEALTAWMAPILSFTAQEIWEALPAPVSGERDEFVFTGVWFDGLSTQSEDNALSAEFWEQLLQVRTEVNRTLELARKDKVVGKALEAQVTLYATPALAETLAKLGDELRFVLITSKATIEVINEASEVPEGASSTELDGLWLSVSPAEGDKCERCWHVTDDIGQSTAHPTLCGRCITNIDDEGEVRQYA